MTPRVQEIIVILFLIFPFRSTLTLRIRLGADNLRSRDLVSHRLKADRAI
jgi:hypothetical protein